MNAAIRDAQRKAPTATNIRQEKLRALLRRAYDACVENGDDPPIGMRGLDQLAERVLAQFDRDHPPTYAKVVASLRTLGRIIKIAGDAAAEEMKAIEKARGRK